MNSAAAPVSSLATIPSLWTNEGAHYSINRPYFVTKPPNNYSLIRVVFWELTFSNMFVLLFTIHHRRDNDSLRFYISYLI